VIIYAMKSLLFFLACLTTDAAFPGSVRETTSKLDGERQVAIEPAWLKTASISGDTKLGGVWSDKSPTNFFLDVVIITRKQTAFLGTPVKQRIAEVVSAKLGIDGEVSDLKAADEVTEQSYTPGLYNSVASMPGHSEATRRFVVPLETVEKMLNGTNVVFQIQLQRERVEGVFSFDQIHFAKRAFKKALAKIKSTPEEREEKKPAKGNVSPGLPRR
jgi:hypothetical protein